jgi:Leucine Rich repeat
MTISESTDIFFGKKVKEYNPNVPADASGNIVYRLTLDYDDSRPMPELIDEFMAHINKSTLEALVIGMWGDPYDNSADAILDKLVSLAPELPRLRALFIGDMTYEECEISWIVQGSYNKLLEAYPKLESLRIRGANSLKLAPFTHEGLREFVIECGGLPSTVARALAQSAMPSLERLELWLGTENYGFDGDVDLYRAVTAKLVTPGLRYLGLRDAEIADQLAQWLAGEAWIEQLETLDLSLGTLGDEGAAALFGSTHIRKLTRLDLSHHFISQEWQDKLAALPVEIVLDDPQEDEDDAEDNEIYRYVAVGE